MQNLSRPGGRYVNVTSTDAATCKVGPGILKKIVVNKAITGTIKVIDNTTGSTANIATVTNPTVGLVLNYDLDFSAGLIVIASATPDLTVVFS